jgi:hypothetical protein
LISTGAAALCALMEPVGPKSGISEGRRTPVPLYRMLRIYFLRAWFILSDLTIRRRCVVLLASTKNKDGQHDLQVHHVSKGEYWYFE